MIQSYGLIQLLTLPKVIRGNSVVMLEALERIGGGRDDR